MGDKRISFSISDRAHRVLRLLAADRDTTQQRIIEQLILQAGEQWLHDRNSTVPGYDEVAARR